MKKLFVGNLPADTRESDLIKLFEPYGKVRSHKLITDLFTRKCKGFGFIEMEGHEARLAVQALDGKDFNGNSIRVSYEKAPVKGRRR